MRPGVGFMVLGLNGAPAPQSHLRLYHNTTWLPHVVVCERAPSVTQPAMEGQMSEAPSWREPLTTGPPAPSQTELVRESQVQPLPRSIPTGFLGRCLSISFRSPPVRLPPHTKAQNEGSLSPDARHAGRSSVCSGSWAVAPPISQRPGVFGGRSWASSVCADSREPLGPPLRTFVPL